tara:strand:- start:12 stop:575 length:564 start_codon:yes stop_codon:yes gene_type:complete
MWLVNLKQDMGKDLNIRWRSFALEQINSKEGEDWKAWEQGEEYISRGLWALRGGIASRKQGDNQHISYMKSILTAKHVNRVDIRAMDAIVDIAKTCDLDLALFTRDLEDESSLTEISNDYSDARSEGIFGTPTIRFEDGSSVFLKMYTPPKSDSSDVFRHILALGQGCRYFGELKRPQPPWPRGALD